MMRSEIGEYFWYPDLALRSGTTAYWWVQVKNTGTEPCAFSVRVSVRLPVPDVHAPLSAAGSANTSAAAADSTVDTDVPVELKGARAGDGLSQIYAEPIGPASDGQLYADEPKFNPVVIVGA